MKDKKTATKILDFLKHNEISWGQNKELKQNDKVIPGSDIIQFTNFLLRNRTREPFAFQEFKEILGMKHFPQDFIKK